MESPKRNAFSATGGVLFALAAALTIPVVIHFSEFIPWYIFVLLVLDCVEMSVSLFIGNVKMLLIGFAACAAVFAASVLIPWRGGVYILYTGNAAATGLAYLSAVILMLRARTARLKKRHRLVPAAVYIAAAVLVSLLAGWYYGAPDKAFEVFVYSLSVSLLPCFVLPNLGLLSSVIWLTSRSC